MKRGNSGRASKSAQDSNSTDLNVVVDSCVGRDRPPASVLAVDGLPCASISVAGDVRVHFNDIETALCEYIRRSHVVVGCMAWLTSTRVLSELAKIAGASIVVQKQDFLRPDLGERTAFKRTLREAYERIKPLDRLDESVGQFGDDLYLMSSCGDPTIAAVRCFGLAKSSGMASPLMHHKFLVFCRRAEWKIESGEDAFEPFAVWTGSYNATRNGTRSLENAVYIDCPAIAAEYFSQWARVAAASEPLDWESEYVSPEWRFGT